MRWVGLPMQDRQGADPRRRMRRFFETLYSCLTRGGRAVLQIYPENSAQAEILTSAAMRAGFSGGLVVDFPHSTRAKKYFLVLMVGGTAAMPAPRGMSGEASDDEEIAVEGRRQSKKRRRVGASGAGVSLASSLSFPPSWQAALTVAALTAGKLLLPALVAGWVIFGTMLVDKAALCGCAVLQQTSRSEGEVLDPKKEGAGAPQGLCWDPWRHQVHRQEEKDSILVQILQENHEVLFCC